MKRFIYILISTLVVGVLLYLGMEYQMKLRSEMAVTFNTKPVIIYSTIFPVLVGMFFRLPKLILEIKEKKRWSFDWMKAVIIGLPSLYIGIVPILAFYFSSNLLFPQFELLIGNAYFTSIAGTVFGYVLLDSLKSDLSSKSTH